MRSMLLMEQLSAAKIVLRYVRDSILVRIIQGSKRSLVTKYGMFAIHSQRTIRLSCNDMIGRLALGRHHPACDAIHVDLGSYHSSG